MNIIAILLPEQVFYKVEPGRELVQALNDQGYHISYASGSQDLLTLLEQNPRIAGIIFDWEQYGIDLCLAINEINEYLPLYAFISTHSVLDVSTNEMRMALYFFEYGLNAVADISQRIRMHHIAIIASDYERSKHFYCQVLGFTLIDEHYRVEWDSWKWYLALQGEYLIDLFSFPGAPRRLYRPEAQGLRHLVFSVADIDGEIASLEAAGVACEPVLVNALTGNKFTFFTDPDRLPLELYES